MGSHSSQSIRKLDQNRRRILTVSALTPICLTLLWRNARADIRERNLSFFHTHTGEKLSIVYHDGLDYLPHSLKSIHNYLRDFRIGECHCIDPKLLDQLYVLQQPTESKGVFEVATPGRILRVKPLNT